MISWTFWRTKNLTARILKAKGTGASKSFLTKRSKDSMRRWYEVRTAQAERKGVEIIDASTAIFFVGTLGTEQFKLGNVELQTY